MADAEKLFFESIGEITATEIASALKLGIIKTINLRDHRDHKYIKDDSIIIFLNAPNEKGESLATITIARQNNDAIKLHKICDINNGFIRTESGYYIFPDDSKDFSNITIGYYEFCLTLDNLYQIASSGGSANGVLIYEPKKTLKDDIFDNLPHHIDNVKDLHVGVIEIVKIKINEKINELKDEISTDISCSISSLNEYCSLLRREVGDLKRELAESRQILLDLRQENDRLNSVILSVKEFQPTHQYDSSSSDYLRQAPLDGLLKQPNIPVLRSPVKTYGSTEFSTSNQIPQFPQSDSISSSVPFRGVPVADFSSLFGRSNHSVPSASHIENYSDGHQITSPNLSPITQFESPNPYIRQFRTSNRSQIDSPNLSLMPQIRSPSSSHIPQFGDPNSSLNISPITQSDSPHSLSMTSSASSSLNSYNLQHSRHGHNF